MIAYLPDFYPDEMLYSFFARYQRHTFTDFWTMCKEFFGKRSNRFSMYHVDGIGKMLQAHVLFERNDFEAILNEHTFFPFWSRFASKERKEKMIQSMFSGKSTYQLSKKVNVIQEFRYCPQCFQNDLDTFGEAYWHREHNIPKIPVCHKHNLFLQNWSPHMSLCRKKLFAPPIKMPRAVRPNTHPLLLNISKRLASYLNSPMESELEPLLNKAKAMGLIGDRTTTKAVLAKLSLKHRHRSKDSKGADDFDIITTTLMSSNLGNKVASGLYPIHVAVLAELATFDSLWSSRPRI